MRRISCFKYYILSLLAIAASSCVDVDYTAQSEILDFPGTVTVPGDLVYGDTVCDTVNIYSTGVWRASIVSEPCPDWITLQTQSGVNLSGAGLVLPLVFSVTDNEDPMNAREAEIRILTEYSQKILKVVQQPLEPRFDVPEPYVYNDIPAAFALDKQEYRVNVNTNWHWTAEILPQTTAEVSIDKTEGYRSGYVVLTIGNNVLAEDEEELKPKVAYLKICSTSTAFAPVVIEFNQKAE